MFSHSYFNRYKTAVFKNIERYLAAKTSGIIAISEIQKQELCGLHRIAPPEKTFVVPLGFDLDRFINITAQQRLQFRAMYGIKDSSFCAAIIGRLVPVKNHLLFLEAAAILKKTRHRKFTALVVGGGELSSQLQQKCAELGLSVSGKGQQAADVVFTSWVTDMPSVLAGTDMVAMDFIKRRYACKPY
jgi:glycosyltransferase involved in cell wall biosynthesis